MLLVGRRWRVVGGLAAGGTAMALISIATVGLERLPGVVRGARDERRRWLERRRDHGI